MSHCGCSVMSPPNADCPEHGQEAVYERMYGPIPEQCPDCFDGVMQAHAQDCAYPFCALNGDDRSCNGHMEPCGQCGGTGLAARPPEVA